METGIELIAQERAEQIEKHGYSIEKDIEYYKNRELESAAMYCLTQDVRYYPNTLPTNFAENIDRKLNTLSESEFNTEMNIIAGAFLAAQVDVDIYLNNQ